LPLAEFDEDISNLQRRFSCEYEITTLQEAQIITFYSSSSSTSEEEEERRNNQDNVHMHKTSLSKTRMLLDRMDKDMRILKDHRVEIKTDEIHDVWL